MIWDFVSHPSTIAAALHALVVVALTVRVIMKRPATGVALAWLLLIAALPLAGPILYLLIGERRIGLQRTVRIGDLRTRPRSSTRSSATSIPRKPVS